MQSLELSKAAVVAEKLRIIAFVKRQLLRGAYGGVALIFLAGIIVWASVLLFAAIALALGPLWSATILLVINVIIFGWLVILALRSRPGSVEIEAVLVRDKALEGAKQQIAISALLGPVGRSAGRYFSRMIWTAVMSPFRGSNSPHK